VLIRPQAVVISDDVCGFGAWKSGPDVFAGVQLKCDLQKAKYRLEKHHAEVGMLGGMTF
jgi:hypothetical protein